MRSTDPGIRFAKGHGTENDFIVLYDPEVVLDLRPDRVATLCDRRTGLGADGVLRVAKAGALHESGVLATLPDRVSAADWFMDYRNADGSVAETCGNGLRVFAHFLAATGSADAAVFAVGTRAGARTVTLNSIDGRLADVTVDMGGITELGSSRATLSGRVYDGLGVDVGNPHLACVDADLTEGSLAALDLSVAPGYDPEFFPAGVNVEFVTVVRDATVTMRVYERGVGETRSCGTGTVAAAVAALRYDGRDDGHIAVRVPGGRVEVGMSAGFASLRGPSVILASGYIDNSWWRGGSAA